jgi:hypothetical protein
MGGSPQECQPSTCGLPRLERRLRLRCRSGPESSRRNVCCVVRPRPTDGGVTRGAPVEPIADRTRVAHTRGRATRAASDLAAAITGRTGALPGRRTWCLGCRGSPGGTRSRLPVPSAKAHPLVVLRPWW